MPIAPKAQQEGLEPTTTTTRSRGRRPAAACRTTCCRCWGDGARDGTIRRDKTHYSSSTLGHNAFPLSIPNAPLPSLRPPPCKAQPQHKEKETHKRRVYQQGGSSLPHLSLAPRFSSCLPFQPYLLQPSVLEPSLRMEPPATEEAATENVEIIEENKVTSPNPLYGSRELLKRMGKGKQTQKDPEPDKKPDETQPS